MKTLTKRSPAKVAIVRIATPAGIESIAIEIALNGETCTIGQDELVKNAKLKDLANELIDYAMRSINHG